MDLIGKKQDSVRSLGAHPKDAAPVMARKGRFGPYAQWGQLVANLPRNVEFTDFTLDQAVALLAEKGKILVPKGKKSKKAAAPAQKAAALMKDRPEQPKVKARPKPKPKTKPKAKPKAAAKPRVKAKSA
jgi:DNA topoisomerase-1